MRRRSTLGGGRGLRRTMRQVRRRRVRMRRRRILLTGGMIAIAVAGTATAIKLSQKDVQRIEQHTGHKPEDLSEAQLDQAIADLNIETEELTDAEVSAIEAADTEPISPPAAPAGPPAAPASQPDYITELERLAELRDKGIITADEFDAKKKQLLGL